MTVNELIEYLREFGWKDIEFRLMDKEGNTSNPLNLYKVDGKFIFDLKDKNGNETNTVILGLYKGEE